MTKYFVHNVAFKTLKEFGTDTPVSSRSRETIAYHKYIQTNVRIRTLIFTHTYALYS